MASKKGVFRNPRMRSIAPRIKTVTAETHPHLVIVRYMGGPHRLYEKLGSGYSFVARTRDVEFGFATQENACAFSNWVAISPLIELRVEVGR
jgi:hypothetical protein